MAWTKGMPVGLNNDTEEDTTESMSLDENEDEKHGEDGNGNRARDEISGMLHKRGAIPAIASLADRQP